LGLFFVKQFIGLKVAIKSTPQHRARKRRAWLLGNWVKGMNLEFVSAVCNVVGTTVLVFYPFNTLTHIDGHEVISWISERKLNGLKLKLQKHAPRFGFVLMMLGSGIQCYITLK